jgi:phosphomannomutase
LSLGMLLAGLLDVDIPLSQLRADLRVPQVLTAEVPVPFAQMGATMRLLRDTLEASAQTLITVDGLRVSDGDAFWLIAPDPQEPLVRLYSSHPDPSEARHQLEALRTKVLAARDHMAAS